MKYVFRDFGLFFCTDGVWADEIESALIVDTDHPDVLADELDAKAVLSPYLNGERVIYVLIEETRGDVNPVYRDEMPLIFPLLDEEELDELFTRLWLRFEPLTMEEVLDSDLYLKRDILFRGKDWRNGEWKYGDLFTQSGTTYIRVHNSGGDHEDFEVIAETVGQFTGMFDEDGERIFEDDIVEWRVNDSTRVGKVVYDEQGFDLTEKVGDIEWSICWDSYRGESRVLGNIYNNIVEGFK